MFDFIIKFFTEKQNKTVFSKQYRDGYVNLWVKSLRDYKP
jgi:hypothetical protein